MTYRLQNLRTHQPCVILEGTWTLGRNDEAEITIPDPSVSGFHATVVNREDGIWVADVESTNGTRVQGELISDWTQVQVGQVVMFGDAAFLLQDEESATETSPATSPVEAVTEPATPPTLSPEPLVVHPAHAVRTIKLPVISLGQTKGEQPKIPEKTDSQLLGLQRELGRRQEVSSAALRVEQKVERDQAVTEPAATSTTEWVTGSEGLRKTYTFPGFADALAFVVEVGTKAELANHHPDIDIRWNKVQLTLITHEAGNEVTEKDWALAIEIDQITADQVRERAKSWAA